MSGDAYASVVPMAGIGVGGATDSQQREHEATHVYGITVLPLWPLPLRCMCNGHMQLLPLQLCHPLHKLR